MKRYFTGAVLSALFVLALSEGVRTDFVTARAHESNGDVRTVFLLHNGWHAALAIRQSDITVGNFPEERDFPGAEYLEISWGDVDYFPAPNAGVFGAIKAGLWSSGSVIHIVGFSGSMEKIYRGAEILEIPLTDNHFARLIEFISGDISRPDSETPAKASPGLFPSSRFYPAKSRFSALRTCNTWIAEALHAASLPVNPSYVITAGQLASQVRRYAIKPASN